MQHPVPAPPAGTGHLGGAAHILRLPVQKIGLTHSFAERLPGGR